MNGKGDIRFDYDIGNYDSLNLLFFSVFGAHFGVDAEQVAEIAVYDGEQADDLFWFHELLGFGAAAHTYFSPTVLTIGREDTQSYRVIIDSLEDIVEFPRKDIRLFPEILEPITLRNGMWGIVPRNGNMMLLVDFYLIQKYKKMMRDQLI